MVSPVRMCIGCRRRAPQAELVRVVAADRSVAADVARRQPGRGAYVHPEASCVQQAVRRKAFGRALRAEVDHLRAAQLLEAVLAELA